MHQQPPPITPPGSETASHPPRQCAECGKEFFARLTRTEHLEFCYDCAQQWATFCELCPKGYRRHDPRRYPKASASKLAAVLAWQYGERGLLLHGETDQGKSRAAWLLLRRLHFAGHGIIAFDAVSFSHEVARQFGSERGPDRWLRSLYSAPVVFLDDLGKCRLTERGEAELFGLIETRTANGKPIIATTNFVGGTLANAMRPETGIPLARRLREFCECIAF